MLEIGLNNVLPQQQVSAFANSLTLAGIVLKLWELAYAIVVARSRSEETLADSVQSSILNWNKHIMKSDFIQSLRLLGKQPAFTAAVLSTLMLGIAGTTIAFTLIYAVLIKPLSYREPDSLLRIALDSPKTRVRESSFSFTRYQELSQSSQSFSEFGAFSSTQFKLSGNDLPELLIGARISSNLLHILGVDVRLGRGFLPAEDAPEGPNVALISSDLWQRRFGSQPDVIGKSITLDLKQYVIVGVMPRGFDFPAPNVDIWVTNVSEPPESSTYVHHGSVGYLTGIARLKPGVSLDMARAEMVVLNQSYVRMHPNNLDANPNGSVRLVRVSDHMVENVRSVLWVLFGAASFVLLGVCANVASLQLARETARAREFAVRAALGASRLSLARPLLVENLVLALVGGLGGVLLAWWGLNEVRRLTSIHLPRLGDLRLDGVVLIFSLLVTIATGLLFGIFPSLQNSRPDLTAVLREHAQLRAPGRHRILGVSPRDLLVVIQVAMAIILLIGAALMETSLVKLQRVDLGFNPSNVVTMQIALPRSRYDTDLKRATFFKKLVDSVETIPGVRAATAAASLPTGKAILAPLQVAGHPMMKEGERPRGIWQGISPSYFRTLGIPLRRGREFTEHDNADAPWVAIINEKMARRFWPEYPLGQDPVGQRLVFGGTAVSAEIVGIAADVHEATLEADMGPEVYMPLAQRCLETMSLLVRTEGDPSQYVTSIRKKVLALDRSQPVSNISSLDDFVESSVGQQRLISDLLMLFAGAAFLLAAIGIYGLISYSVAQQTQELGIRYALGAQPGKILGMVIGRGIYLTLIGMGIGMSGATLLASLLKGLLFGVSATDPETFAGMAFLFTVIAALASYIPARRATRIDPLIALK